MKLNDILSADINKAEWEAKGYELPKFDIEAVARKTHAEPTWVRLVEIFRAPSLQMSTRSLPSRSAMVRATFSMRP